MGSEKHRFREQNSIDVFEEEVSVGAQAQFLNQILNPDRKVKKKWHNVVVL